MTARFAQWDIDLFKAIVRDADARGFTNDPEEYMAQCYDADLAQFPNRLIFFNDPKKMMLFKLKYSEYL